MPVTKTFKTSVTTGKTSFFIIWATADTLILLNLSISIYKFHLLWSAEMSKSQIVNFRSLAYYIRDLKKTKRGEVTAVWSHMFSVIFRFQKYWEKNYAKNLILCFFEMSALWNK